MNLQQIIKNYLKKICSDLHSAIVNIVLVALIVSVGGIYFFSKNLWILLKTTIQSPTPLWATIILVLVVQVYIYLKIQQLQQSYKHSLIHKPELFLKFNVFWDKDKNRYCPKCKNILGKYQKWHDFNEFAFQCYTCKQTYQLLRINGDEISLNEALEFL